VSAHTPQSREQIVTPLQDDPETGSTLWLILLSWVGTDIAGRLK